MRAITATSTDVEVGLFWSQSSRSAESLWPVVAGKARAKDNGLRRLLVLNIHVLCRRTESWRMIVLVHFLKAP